MGRLTKDPTVQRQSTGPEGENVQGEVIVEKWRERSKWNSLVKDGKKAVTLI